MRRLIVSVVVLGALIVGLSVAQERLAFAEDKSAARSRPSQELRELEKAMRDAAPEERAPLLRRYQELRRSEEAKRRSQTKAALRERKDESGSLQGEPGRRAPGSGSASGSPGPRAAPGPAVPALTIDADLSLSSASNIFKDGDLFLWSDTIGNQGVGERALEALTYGYYNLGVGEDALRGLDNGFSNVAIGPSAMRQAGTYPLPPYSSYPYANTSVGTWSLSDMRVGYANTAIGNRAMADAGYMGYPTATSFAIYDNTALGSRALEDTIGSQNTAVGAWTLRRQTSGSGNTAVGRGAMSYAGYLGYPTNAAVTIYDNTAVGRDALDKTTASENTALGSRALQRQTSGSGNTAVGRGAMSNAGYLGYPTYAAVSIYDNTAVGRYALDNTTASENTALGVRALGINDTGYRNVAVGSWAGSSVDAAYGAATYNIHVGAWQTGQSTDTNLIRIGNVQSKAYVAGIYGTTTGSLTTLPVYVDNYGQLGTTASSRRVKEEIAELGSVSDRLLSLRPVSFRFKEPSRNGAKPVQFGLIAEEVAEVFPELVVFDDEGQPKTVKYHVLSTLLINELQKQRDDFDKQTEVVVEQQELLRELLDRVRGLEARQTRSAGPAASAALSSPTRR